MAAPLPAVAVDPSMMPLAAGGSSKPLMPPTMGGACFVGHRTLLAALAETYCAGIRQTIAAVRESTRCGPAEGDMIPLGFVSSSPSPFDAATGARV